MESLIIIHKDKEKIDWLCFEKIKNMPITVAVFLIYEYTWDIH
jgi:hypothetical protein